MKHADKIAETEYEVIRDAIKFVNCQTEYYLIELSATVHYLQRLRAEMCKKCAGTGMLPGHSPGCYPQYEQCKGCKQCDCKGGRKPDAEDAP